MYACVYNKYDGKKIFSLLLSHNAKKKTKKLTISYIWFLFYLD